MGATRAREPEAKHSIYDAADSRTASAFDAVNRLAAGRLTGTTDRLGRRLDFTYDDTNNKLTEKWYANGGGLDQTQTWSYDALGQMLTAVDPDGANTFTYDSVGRAKTVQEPFGLTLTYTYDAANNRTVFQDSKGGLETFAYDAANRLTSVKFTNSLATIEYDFVYDARDSITKLTRYGNINGTATVGWTSFTYDTRGRLTNEQHRDSSNTSLNNTTFTYDNFDRLTTKKVDGTTTTYSYDTTNQLTSDGTRNYAYDANGNRNSAGYTTGTGNQTTNDGTWTYTYDNEGNLSKKSKGASLETWNYSYDQQNHLVTVEKHATDGGTLQLKVQYKYDAVGNRLERTEDSDGNGTVDVTDRFGYDGANVWADLNGSNGLNYRRLFGEGVDNPVARITPAGTVVWYLTDYQNSVIGMVDYLGASLGSITYDPYGNILTDTTGVNGDRFKFTSREWDSAVKLQYNRERYYDPGIGKWTSTDPLGFEAGDANLYRYVGNGPTDRSDPEGLKLVSSTRPREVLNPSIVFGRDFVIKFYFARLAAIDKRLDEILKRHAVILAELPKLLEEGEKLQATIKDYEKKEAAAQKELMKAMMGNNQAEIKKWQAEVDAWSKRADDAVAKHDALATKYNTLGAEDGQLEVEWDKLWDEKVRIEAILKRLGVNLANRG